MGEWNAPNEQDEERVSASSQRIPAECTDILASQFKAIRICRLIDPESVRYSQVVVLAVRRSRRERDQLRNGDPSMAARWRYPRSTAPNTLAPGGVWFSRAQSFPTKH